MFQKKISQSISSMYGCDNVIASYKTNLLPLKSNCVLKSIVLVTMAMVVITGAVAMHKMYRIIFRMDIESPHTCMSVFTCLPLFYKNKYLPDEKELVAVGTMAAYVLEKNTLDNISSITAMCSLVQEIYASL